jgi:hypothetical protein
LSPGGCVGGGAAGWKGPFGGGLIEAAAPLEEMWSSVKSFGADMEAVSRL